MFNNWFKKEKPLFTGSRFGFGSGGGAAGPTAYKVGDFFEFQVWGGGGGSGGSGNDPGGGGAYVSVKYNILKGTTLRFIVGSGGRYNPVALKETAYGGGGGKGTTHNYPASTGAGLSGIFITDNPLYDAASPAPSRTVPAPSPPSPSNVVGGGLEIATCLMVAAGGGGASYDGGAGGGGITAGGAAEPISGANAGSGASWNGAGTDSGSVGGGGHPDGNGFLFAGGQTTGGGGGGSGVWGGGAGDNGSSVASGGGGASYYWTSQSKPPAFVSYLPGSIVSAAGNPGYAASNKGQVGGGAGDNNPGGNFGKGNGPNANGGDGRIAYRRHDSYAQLPLGDWVLVDYTGDTQSLVV